MARRKKLKTPKAKPTRRVTSKVARRTRSKSARRVKAKSVRRAKAKVVRRTKATSRRSTKTTSARRAKIRRRITLTLARLRREIAAKALGWVGERQPARRIRMSARPRHRALRRVRLVVTEAAVSPPIDWRTKAALSAPRDQGTPNTCTSFALCTTIQDLRSIAGNPSPALAPGFIHTCIGKKQPSDGYNLRSAARDIKGVLIPRATANNYPWPAGQCGAAQGVPGLSDWSELTVDEQGKAALQAGPVVAVMKLYLDFRKFYGGGVYRRLQSPTNTFEGEHSVAVVGFGNDDGGYWIVKNSFGVAWGSQGFARVAFGECGLLTGLQAVRISV